MRKLLYILILILLLVVSGCACMAKPKPGPVKPAPVPAPVKPQPVVAKSECGVSSATGFYPCEGCTVVKLEKSMPAEVAMNSKFDYTIKVTNPTGYIVSDVVVTENLANNFKLVDTNPNARADGGKLTFDVGMLGPGQAKVLTVSGMATNTECVKTCASVTYIIPTCASVKVVQPALKLVKTAPASVLICESIPVKFVVSNTGSGSAGEIKIEDTLPAGLKTADGKNTIVINAGNLAPGQSKEFTATLKADKTGKYENKAVASSSAGLKAEASTTTEVHQPVLAISKTGPEKQFLGRSISYEIKVTNKGDAPAASAVLTDTVPSGVSGVKASDGGKVGAANVVWNLGTLAAGASKTVTVSYTPTTAGTLSNTAKATAVCAAEVSASAKTTIAGIAAVLLEVIDTEDPVAVGSTEMYVITATNQGSSPDTNIKIVCTLEDNEQYVSSSGATKGTQSGNTVTFEPLPTLAPKAQAAWRVTVKAMKAGDVRFTVVMTSDQLTRPVQETEATHLYE